MKKIGLLSLVTTGAVAVGTAVSMNSVSSKQNKNESTTNNINHDSRHQTRAANPAQTNAEKYFKFSGYRAASYFGSEIKNPVDGKPNLEQKYITSYAKLHFEAPTAAGVSGSHNNYIITYTHVDINGRTIVKKTDPTSSDGALTQLGKFVSYDAGLKDSATVVWIDFKNILSHEFSFKFTNVNDPTDTYTYKPTTLTETRRNYNAPRIITAVSRQTDASPDLSIAHLLVKWVPSGMKVRMHNRPNVQLKMERLFKSNLVMLTFSGLSYRETLDDPSNFKIEWYFDNNNNNYIMNGHNMDAPGVTQSKVNVSEVSWPKETTLDRFEWHLNSVTGKPYTSSPQLVEENSTSHTKLAVIYGIIGTDITSIDMSKFITYSRNNVGSSEMFWIPLADKHTFTSQPISDYNVVVDSSNPGDGNPYSDPSTTSYIYNSILHSRFIGVPDLSHNIQLDSELTGATISDPTLLYVPSTAKTGLVKVMHNVSATIERGTGVDKTSLLNKLGLDDSGTWSTSANIDTNVLQSATSMGVYSIMKNGYKYEYNFEIEVSDTINPTTSGLVMNGNFGDPIGPKAGLETRIKAVSNDANNGAITLEWQDTPPSTIQLGKNTYRYTIKDQAQNEKHGTFDTTADFYNMTGAVLTNTHNANVQIVPPANGYKRLAFADNYKKNVDLTMKTKFAKNNLEKIDTTSQTQIEAATGLTGGTWTNITDVDETDLSVHRVKIGTYNIAEQNGQANLAINVWQEMIPKEAKWSINNPTATEQLGLKTDSGGHVVAISKQETATGFAVYGVDGRFLYNTKGAYNDLFVPTQFGVNNPKHTFNASLIDPSLGSQENIKIASISGVNNLPDVPLIIDSHWQTSLNPTISSKALNDIKDSETNSNKILFKDAVLSHVEDTSFQEITNGRYMKASGSGMDRFLVADKSKLHITFERLANDPTINIYQKISQILGIQHTTDLKYYADPTDLSSPTATMPNINYSSATSSDVDTTGLFQYTIGGHTHLVSISYNVVDSIKPIVSSGHDTIAKLTGSKISAQDIIGEVTKWVIDPNGGNKPTVTFKNAADNKEWTFDKTKHIIEMVATDAAGNSTDFNVTLESIYWTKPWLDTSKTQKGITIKTHGVPTFSALHNSKYKFTTEIVFDAEVSQTDDYAKLNTQLGIEEATGLKGGTWTSTNNLAENVISKSPTIIGDYVIQDGNKELTVTVKESVIDTTAPRASNQIVDGVAGQPVVKTALLSHFSTSNDNSGVQPIITFVDVNNVPVTYRKTDSVVKVKIADTTGNSVIRTITLRGMLWTKTYIDSNHVLPNGISTLEQRPSYWKHDSSGTTPKEDFRSEVSITTEVSQTPASDIYSQAEVENATGLTGGTWKGTYNVDETKVLNHPTIIGTYTVNDGDKVLIVTVREDVKDTTASKWTIANKKTNIPMVGVIKNGKIEIGIYDKTSFTENEIRSLFNITDNSNTAIITHGFKDVNGLTTLKVTATDASGNTSELKIDVKLTQKPALPSQSDEDNGLLIIILTAVLANLIVAGTIKAAHKSKRIGKNK